MIADDIFERITGLRLFQRAVVHLNILNVITRFGRNREGLAVTVSHLHLT